MAEEKTFRHKVVTGALTLPVCSLLTCVLWYFSREDSVAHWLGLVVVGLSAYVIAEWNNRNALLRIRSRLMSAVYLVLMAAFSFLHQWNLEILSTLSLLGAYYTLFNAYQKPRAEVDVFHTFVLLGIGGIFFPLLLFLVPFFFSSMLIQLRVLNWRTFCAGIIGLLLPYWFYGIWAFWRDTLEQDLQRWTEYFSLPNWESLSFGWEQIVSFGFLAVFSLIAVVHFVRTSFNDKIRTRMLLYIIMLQEVVLASMLVVWPNYFDTWMFLLVANSSPFIAHYFALARGRGINIFFNITIGLIAILGIANSLNIWKLL